MSIAILRQVGLLLHIIGLAMAAGITLVSYIASRKFLTQYTQDKEKGVAILRSRIDQKEVIIIFQFCH